MELTYNITTKPVLQSNGYYKTEGMLVAIDDMGNTIDMFRCISGGHGRGTIPIGHYIVNDVIKLANKPTDDCSAYQLEGFPWIANLSPLGKCEDARGDRTDLAIHPEGNLPGTLGCIGIIMEDLRAFETLSTYLQEGIKLYVC